MEMVCCFTGPGGVGRLWCPRVSLVISMAGVVLVLLMPLAPVLYVFCRVMLRVAVPLVMAMVRVLQVLL